MCCALHQLTTQAHCAGHRIRQDGATQVKERASKAEPTVQQVKILRDVDKEGQVKAKSAKSKGFAFVELTDHEHALCALRQLNNNPVPFGASPLHMFPASGQDDFDQSHECNHVHSLCDHSFNHRVWLKIRPLQHTKVNQQQTTLHASEGASRLRKPAWPHTGRRSITGRFNLR